MKPYPETPSVDDCEDRVLEEGHLWLRELIDGEPLRFQVQESGLIRFGDGDRVFRSPEDVSARYRHAVRHVRDAIDREALRSAVDGVESVVFFGVATSRRTVEYDWDRLPSFLGTDVWTGEAFRPPDATEAILERLGLEPVNAFEREFRARDFDPDSYAIPESTWYDGPAAGVVIRNKRGGRARLRNDEIDRGAPPQEAPDDPIDDLLESHATRERFEQIAAQIGDDRGHPPTIDELADRVHESIAREMPPEMFEYVAHDDLRSELAAETRAFLGDWDDHSDERRNDHSGEKRDDWADHSDERR